MGVFINYGIRDIEVVNNSQLVVYRGDHGYRMTEIIDNVDCWRRITSIDIPFTSSRCVADNCIYGLCNNTPGQCSYVWDVRDTTRVTMLTPYISEIVVPKHVFIDNVIYLVGGITFNGCGSSHHPTNNVTLYDIRADRYLDTDICTRYNQCVTSACAYN